jgi:peroxiredoxin Q/BCP
LEIKEGDSFPSFTLLDQNSNSFNISDYLGKEKLVVYFYPKNETYGCTKQACNFRDEFSAFQNLNCRVIGVSNDSPKSHLSFANNHQLPFTLLLIKGDPQENN